MTSKSSELDPVYLDSNATTPLDQDVLDVISTTLSQAWGNPSSSHKYGVSAKQAMDKARQQVATMINAATNDIIFTSGGTEANNWVFDTIQKHHKQSSTDDSSPLHVITSNIEHDSVAKPLQALADQNLISLTVVPVRKPSGIVDPSDVIQAITPNTLLISIMLANNETGNIQPIQEISELLKANQEFSNVFLHTDAAQAIGKIPVDVSDLGCDYLTIVGHKFYGPRIGALFRTKSAPLYPWLLGGGQEDGLRSGTENVGMCAGLGAAAALVTENLDSYSAHMLEMRDSLESQLSQAGVPFEINSNVDSRLPNTCAISLVGDSPDLIGSNVLAALSDDIIASTGSACHAGSTTVSRVLVNSGASTPTNALRLSVGRTTTQTDIDRVAKALINHYNQIE